MKEINDIIAAYDEAVAQGKKTALATVVHVEGSSYRRPGARMLVTEDGILTGAISGGCLEGDALRRALLAIHENKNKLVTYDTTDEDDARIGIQLGCNGIVHILFEPLNSEAKNPLTHLRAVAAQRTDAALVTLFSLARNNEQPGTILSIADNKTITADRSDAAQLILADTASALESGTSAIKEYGHFNAFIQVVQPAISLVIFGAGNDAMPLVSIAHKTGWEVTVIDGRYTHASKKRFPLADRVYVAKAETALQNVSIDKLTTFVLMTHNYNYDISILQQLLHTDTPYIGILGPRTKFERMQDDLSAKGISISPEEMSRIYSPVGLDIGAETAEEIALSIAGEIKAILSGRSAQSLRNKMGSIHQQSDLL
jgi:xanthine/CO dehydrogenase XdhC/CoxF family maturation factor